MFCPVLLLHTHKEVIGVYFCFNYAHFGSTNSRGIVIIINCLNDHLSVIKVNLFTAEAFSNKGMQRARLIESEEEEENDKPRCISRDNKRNRDRDTHSGRERDC